MALPLTTSLLLYERTRTMQATLLEVRIVRHRVELDQWGHDIAVPCLVRVFVDRFGRRHMYSGNTEQEALLNAEQANPGLIYDWKAYA